jgi:hypothetical protein
VIVTFSPPGQANSPARSLVKPNSQGVASGRRAQTRAELPSFLIVGLVRGAARGRDIGRTPDLTIAGLVEPDPAKLARVGPGAPSEERDTKGHHRTTWESMKLSLDWYTLRSQEWTALQFVDYCTTHGIDSVQLSARRHFASLEERDLAPVKRRADELGVMVEIGAGGVDRRHAASWDPARGPAELWLASVLRAAAYFGSPSVHCVLGGRAERTGPVPLGQQIEECVRVSLAAAPLSRDLGVKLAYETHGDLLAREMV